MTAVLSTCNNPLPQLMVGAQLEQQHQPTTLHRRPIPFPLPKKLGSDRLLLVSKALNETPTYKSLSPELIKQRDSLKPSNHERREQEQQQQRKRRVGFRAVDKVHVYEKEYDETDHDDMWFTSSEFDYIFHRDDDYYTICYSSMAHTKQILQLWGICSRGDTIDESKKAVAVEALFRDPPHPHARGLENRIITGIRNHRQKAVQSFLQQQQQQQQSEGTDTTTICPRYLKFSQTAQRFSQALAEGDARIAQIIKDEPWVDDDEDDEVEWCYY